jgi:hypothetical protein
MTYVWIFVGIVFIVLLAVAVKHSVSHPPAAPETPSEGEYIPRDAAGPESLNVARNADGSFRIEILEGHSIRLGVLAATEIHRYLSPRGGCDCAKNDSALTSNMSMIEKDGKLFYETKLGLPGDQIISLDDVGTVAIRDNYSSTIKVERRAAHKIHVLLRPPTCACVCLQDGVAVPVKA